MTKVSACILLAGLLSTNATAQIKSTPLTGTWRVTEVATTGPDARTNSSPQPALYIFTGTHYSIMRVDSDKPRPAMPQDQTKASVAELLAIYNTIEAQSGTYEISGGNLTLRPLVARNPDIMAAGTFSISSFQVAGNKLTITQTRNTKGEPVANPTTRVLTRIE